MESNSLLALGYSPDYHCVNFFDEGGDFFWNITIAYVLRSKNITHSLCSTFCQRFGCMGKRCAWAVLCFFLCYIIRFPGTEEFTLSNLYQDFAGI
mmetsp:Transcript_43356/g.101719  ORF Transcript_43356/g.101719 Transcript_43356/m.101719 type:complete len:95 (+) Transcript_43356:958-1242(+)